MFDMKPAGKAFRDAIKGYRHVVKAHSLSGDAIEVGIVILILAIIVGGIAFPIFFGTNTTGWGATNILVWGVVPTVSLAVVIVGLIKHFQKAGHRAD